MSGDPVNHPSHYQATNGVECIDAIQAALTPAEFRGYLKGNIIKYTFRELKKNGLQDIQKLGWYADRLDAFVQSLVNDES